MNASQDSRSKSLQGHLDIEKNAWGNDSPYQYYSVHNASYIWIGNAPYTWETGFSMPVAGYIDVP